MLDTVERLLDYGVEFRSLMEGVEMKGAEGKLMLALFKDFVRSVSSKRWNIARSEHVWSMPDGRAA